MRIALIVLLVFALGGTAGAQSRGGRTGRSEGRTDGRSGARTEGRIDGRTDGMPTQSIGLPLPQIGLPLPTIGLPLPPMGLSQPGIPPVPAATIRGNNRPGRISAGPHRGLPQLIYAPTLGWPYLQEWYPYQDPYPSYPQESPLPPLPSPEELQPTGGLSLELQPGVNPQIYIDGYFVSMLSDVGDELIVDAGSHALELHQDGFETLRFDVQVPQDRVVTYRGELKSLNARPSAEPARASVAPAPAPTTIYVIPGCYVGNVRPASARLPAGCDVRDAVAFPSR